MTITDLTRGTDTAGLPPDVKSYLDSLGSSNWVESFTLLGDGTPVAALNTPAGTRLCVLGADKEWTELPTGSGAVMSPEARGTVVAFWSVHSGSLVLGAIDTASGECRELGVTSAGVPRQIRWYDDDSLLTSTVTGDRVSIVRVDVADGAVTPLVELAAGRGTDPAPDANDDGDVVYLAANEHSHDLCLRRPDGSVSVLVRGNRSATPGVARWAPDGKRLAIAVRRAKTVELRILDLAAGLLELLAVPEPAGPAVWHPSGTRLAVPVNQWPRTTVCVVDATSRDHELIPVPDDVSVSSPRWADDRLTAVGTGPGHPPSLWVTEDPVAAPLVPVAESGPAGPDLSCRTTTVPHPGGFDLPALVTEPAGAAVGTVVMLHGGPAGVWRLGWTPVVPVFAAAGFRVIQLETRGSTVQGRRIPPVPQGHHGDAEAQDVGVALAGLAGLGLAGIDKVAVVGHSHGGFVAYRASRVVDHVVAAVLTSGYLTPEDLDASTDPQVRRFRADAFDAIADDPGPLPAGCPVLLVSGQLDTQIPLSDVTTSFGRLAGDGHRHLVLPDEGHAYRHRASVVRWLGTAVRFVRAQVAGGQ